MNGQRRAFLTIAGVVLLLAAAVAAEQAKPAVQPPARHRAAERRRRAASASWSRRCAVRPSSASPTPVSKRDGKHDRHDDQGQEPGVRRRSPGLKVDEFWYDKAGDPVTGAQPFRYRKPLQPGEVIEVVLKVPTNPKMNRNQYKFEHANGTIKTTQLPKL